MVRTLVEPDGFSSYLPFYLLCKCTTKSSLFSCMLVFLNSLDMDWLSLKSYSPRFYLVKKGCTNVYMYTTGIYLNV